MTVMKKVLAVVLPMWCAALQIASGKPAAWQPDGNAVSGMRPENREATEQVVPASLPRNIYSGVWDAGHVQGIAVDTGREHMYFSFTTMLVKTDLEGNVIGTVTGLLGHLGCLAFNDGDGRLYGSLEYKNDVIGKGILNREKSDKTLDDGFYVAIFDVEKITGEGMNAERDGIMTTVFLPTVLADYKAKVTMASGAVHEHRFGCSGIDGITFGPAFGRKGGKRFLTVAYGIYGDTTRTDNDCQVLLQYGASKLRRYETSLSQDNMHRNGPARPAGTYFVRTGNTSWGVQNLEYDAGENLWFMAVYPGKKKGFANFGLFAIDGSKAPVKRRIAGTDYVRKARVLTLCERGMRDPRHPAICGWHFKYGTTGLCSLGGGLFYISHNGRTPEGQECNARLYRFIGSETTAFEPVE